MKDTEKQEPGKSKAKSKSTITPGIDDKLVIQALVREKGLGLSDAERVLKEVKAELKAQQLTSLPEDTFKGFIDTKITELERTGSLLIKKPAEGESYFDDPAPEMTENALRVLERRYLKKDHQGKPMEKPQQMFRRVARTIAEVDKEYDPDTDLKAIEDEFYRLMTRFEFMPNSPTLMNAGRELGQLSACFVLPVEDSLDSIFDAVKHTAMIHKSGGGTGFSFNRLRPKNDMVSSTKGVASGPISFMKVFDSATEEIKQGGTRRGANMGILNVDHPDILDFINCKQDNKTLNNFNISVGITENFMEAVDKDMEYPTRNPRSKDKVLTLKAGEVFEQIVDGAWRNGEPGIIFLDRMNKDNPTPLMGEIESTNPCGEQPLLPYESCNLGSINLAKVVEQGSVDWDKLTRIVHSAAHFLDNVIDKNNYPIDLIGENTKSNRKIGLGVMGFADMLIMLGIPYNSEEAIEVAEKIMEHILEQGRQASALLAEQRGTFPNFEDSIYNQPGQSKLRNATITTIAPTGTISIISGCSSGIEPLFAISYVRNVMDNTELAEVNPLFEKAARDGGFYSDELMKEIAAHGTVQELESVPKELKKYFVTSHDIMPEWHIRMQAAFQRYTDNAVSKTVNFSNDATREDIAEVYRLAYKLGCKGVTVYRDGSRDSQVLNIEKVNRTKEEIEDKFMHEISTGHRLEPRPRPENIRGMTRKMPTGCGSLYVTINEDDYGLFEVFTNMGKAGGCAASQAEANSRLISLALRAGIKTEDIVRQLKGISCPMMTWWEGGEKILSCADAIGKCIELYPEYEKNGSHKVDVKPPAGETADPLDIPKPREFSHQVVMCPDCGGTVEYKEGCLVCSLCGYSKC